ncbi:hypothetical protein DV735_g2218, partial [Chaetothyriales sp. CBS 134920]
MMGAQARAAEYNAARNASARQASREAEELQLPPKPTPISLSSFSRSAAIQSRNKGPKKFTPLILDPSEVSEVAAADDQAKSSPAVMSPPAAGHGSHSSDRIRVNLPAAGVHSVPSAPRAMRPSTDPFAHNTPTRMGMAIGSGPRVIPPAGQYGMTPNVPMPIFHPSLNTACCPPGATPEAISMLCDGLAPLDITPTKQEHKLSAISQAYSHHPYTSSNLDPAFGMACPPAAPSGQASFALHAAQIAYPYVEFPGVAVPTAWDNGQPILNNPIFPKPALQHGRPDTTPMSQVAPALPQPHSDMTPMSQQTSAPSAGRLLLRQHPSAEDYEARLTPSRAKIHPSADNSVASKSRDNNGEAYDRNSKMQLFVAAQQAFAKTGKTVLNSREADEGQGGKSGIPAEHGQEPPVPRAAPLAPPGLGAVPKWQKDFGQNNKDGQGGRQEAVSEDSRDGESDKQEDQEPISETDAMLHDMFGVGTDSWFDLRPPTKEDRQKMRLAMRYVGSRMHESYRRGDGRDRR